MARERHDPLLIADYDGTPRGGKGSIVKSLKENHHDVASDETGIDFRVITQTLIADGILHADMEKRFVAKAIESVPVYSLAAVIKARDGLISEYGDVLYGDDVTGLVSQVSPFEHVRDVVKTGLKDRIAAVRDNPEIEVLALDGRGLSKVASQVDGTEVLLKTFVTCSPEEAARRECLRRGIEFFSPEGQTLLSKTIKRFEDDANREIDPVKPESGAIDYWQDPRVFELGLDFVYAIDKLSGESATEIYGHEAIPRWCVGALAARSNRQVIYDTTRYNTFNSPIKRMVRDATRMLDDARDMHSVREYAPAVISRK